MATKHWFRCLRGHEDAPLSMFVGLQGFAQSGPRQCASCEEPSRYLFKFEVGLDGSGSRCEAIAVYLPDRVERWDTAAGEAVEFFPFLVILRTADSAELSCWLPYWHLVHTKQGIKTKYGQYAPMMQSDLFEDLLRKARLSGYLSS
jgi:hypothetical protein